MTYPIHTVPLYLFASEVLITALEIMDRPLSYIINVFRNRSLLTVTGDTRIGLEGNPTANFTKSGMDK